MRQLPSDAVRSPTRSLSTVFSGIARACVEADRVGTPRLVAMEGKTCRGSHGHSKTLGPLHSVSAWLSEQGITLGQIATDEKSNVVTTIPQLLEHIDLHNSIVTMDAMGPQKKIFEQIDIVRWPWLGQLFTA